jgi:hypothetical protein
MQVVYYPATALGLVVALATLYHRSLPKKLPWRRGLPGAALAMLVFLCSTIGLRLYLRWVTGTGYTYGALAAPIAFLLFAFFLALSITSARNSITQSSNSGPRTPPKPHDNAGTDSPTRHGAHHHPPTPTHTNASNHGTGGIAPKTRFVGRVDQREGQNGRLRREPGIRPCPVPR